MIQVLHDVNCRRDWRTSRYCRKVRVSVTFPLQSDFVLVCYSQSWSISLCARVEIDGSRDHSVTSATILPKGGPLFSCEGAHLDFHQVSIQGCCLTNIPLVPKILKLSVALTLLQKNIFENVPKGGTVIVPNASTTPQKCALDYFGNHVR